MSHSENLQPCPFCGTRPKTYKLLDDTVYIYCTSCEATAKVHESNWEKAMSVWNTRFTTTPATKPTPYTTKTDVSNPYEVGRDYSFVLIGQITFDGSILQAFDEEIILRESLSRNTIIIRRDKILWARAM